MLSVGSTTSLTEGQVSRMASRDVSTKSFEEYANQVDEEFNQWADSILAAANKNRDEHVSDGGD